jgi:ferritin-like protein
VPLGAGVGPFPGTITSPPVPPPGASTYGKLLRCRFPLRAYRHQSRNDQEDKLSSVGYHEPVDELSDETRDMHRAIVSLMEELEAVDWYNQRADACKDRELKAILEHNRDEEKEHASMVLEWIRRKDLAFSKELKDYLFTEKPIAHR